MTREVTSKVRRDSILGMTLHTEIIIEASPRRVWDALTDFASYGDWNQSIPHAQGVASAGTHLRVTIHWPGLRPGPYVLEVLAAEADRELRWLGRFWKTGLMDGDHRFVIEPIGDKRCKVTQTEYFYGWLVPLFAHWLKRNVLSGFEQMDAALKSRVETEIPPPPKRMP